MLAGCIIEGEKGMSSMKDIRPVMVQDREEVMKRRRRRRMRRSGEKIGTCAEDIG
jgi:hypothetical protein